MNKVILLGRLTKDPDTRQAGETTVSRFNLAVNRRYKKEGGQDADFPNVVTFGKTAEFVSKYLHKGSKIALEGRIVTGSYKDNNGVTRYTTEVVADNVEFAESKKVDSDNNSNNNSNTDNEWVNVDDAIAEDLPFV